ESRRSLRSRGAGAPGASSSAWAAGEGLVDHLVQSVLNLLEIERLDHHLMHPTTVDRADDHVGRWMTGEQHPHYLWPTTADRLQQGHAVNARHDLVHYGDVHHVSFEHRHRARRIHSGQQVNGIVSEAVAEPTPHVGVVVHYQHGHREIAFLAHRRNFKG